MTSQTPPFQGTLFEENFLVRTLGTIAYSPDIALTELVANAWDAGASRVDLTIPDSPGKELVIADNGCGMLFLALGSRIRALSSLVASARTVIERGGNEGSAARATEEEIRRGGCERAGTCVFDLCTAFARPILALTESEGMSSSCRGILLESRAEIM